MKSSNVVMRPLKDGSGFSPCKASDENVGKRKCNHTHSTVFNVKVTKIGRNIQTIEISDEYDKLDKRDKQEVIKKFTEALDPISKKQFDKVKKELSLSA